MSLFNKYSVGSLGRRTYQALSSLLHRTPEEVSAKAFHNLQSTFAKTASRSSVEVYLELEDRAAISKIQDISRDLPPALGEDLIKKTIDFVEANYQQARYSKLKEQTLDSLDRDRSHLMAMRDSGPEAMKMYREKRAEAKIKPALSHKM